MLQRKSVTGMTLTLLVLGLLTSAVNVELTGAVPSSPYIAVVPEQTIDPTLTPGMNYTISIYTDYSGIDIWAWQFELTFNASILEGLQVSNGDVISTAKHSSATFFPGTFENTLGKLSLTVAFFFYMSPPPPVTFGPGTLAQVTFRVIGYGFSDIAIGPHTALVGPAQPPDYLFAYKIIAANQVPGRTSPPYGSDHIGNAMFDNRLQKVVATADTNPDTLDLKSKGKWITTYIQLPEDYDPADIDASTILLNDTIAPVLDPDYGFVKNPLVDHNSDGILERMLKFDRASIASWIYQSVGMQHEIALTITGKLADGTSFEGTITIRAFWQGHMSPSKR